MVTLLSAGVDISLEQSGQRAAGGYWSGRLAVLPRRHTWTEQICVGKIIYKSRVENIFFIYIINIILARNQKYSAVGTVLSALIIKVNFLLIDTVSWTKGRPAQQFDGTAEPTRSSAGGDFSRGSGREKPIEDEDVSKADRERYIHIVHMKDEKTERGYTS